MKVFFLRGICSSDDGDDDGDDDDDDDEVVWHSLPARSRASLGPVLCVHLLKQTILWVLLLVCVTLAARLQNQTRHELFLI